MGYDGKGKLAEALAALYGYSAKSHNKTAELVKQAKDALGITSNAKHLPDDVKLSIYRWHVDRNNAATAIQTDIVGEPLSDTPTISAEPMVDRAAIPVPPLAESTDSPATPEPEAAAQVEPSDPVSDSEAATDTRDPPPESNWGGVRLGAGRKPTGKQTVTVRVPVELVGMIEQAKRTGLINATYNQSGYLQAKVTELEKALQHSKADYQALVKAHAQQIGERDRTIKALQPQPHPCQGLTQAGGKCPNKASREAVLGGYAVYLCAAHYRKLAV
jgi:hypothetical protein